MAWLKENLIEIAFRTVKTAAQAAIGAIGTTAVVFHDVNWQMVGGTVLLAAIVCVLMNIAMLERGKKIEEVG